jgi:predicted ATPase
MGRTKFLAQIYSHSFKGLPNGWKSMNHVNFIVGENSTGKTSLFDLLEIIDSSKFAFAHQILGIATGLDEADDVITRFGNENAVTVGFVRPTDDSQDEQNAFTGLLITYKRQRTSLTIEHMTVIDGRSALKIKKSGNRLMVKKFDAPEKSISFDVVCKLALRAHNDKSTGYTVFTEISNLDELESEWIGARMFAGDTLRRMSKSSKSDKPKPRKITNFIMSTGFNIFRFGPMRSEILRIITATTKTDFEPSGNHFPFRLKEMQEKRPDSFKALQIFGLESGLFDDIRIQKLKGGSTEAFSILYRKSNREFHASELGYGLGQIIPIVTDLLFADGTQTFLIQQPEVHLHPKAQAAFGKLMYSIAQNGPNLIIETHSDFIIDRYRMSMANGDQKIDSQILFFENNSEDKKPTFNSIDILPDGKLESPPDSYRDFFLNEAINMFEFL